MTIPHTRKEKKMTTAETENVAPEIEMLARMWIECDPNRNIGADEPDPSNGGKPRWQWFIPRAEETSRFVQENGYRLSKGTT
jgi:hypothetical protein